MSYLTVKDGIVGILNKLELAESLQAYDFKNASENEYDNTFILRSLSGEMDREDLNVGFTDKQEWEILIALPKSGENDVIQSEEVHARKDVILATINDADNWRSFVRVIKYKNWKVDNLSSYFLLTVTITVIDTYTY